MNNGTRWSIPDDLDREALLNEVMRLLDEETCNTVTVHIDIRSDKTEDGFTFLMEADSVETAREELEQLLLTD